MVYIDITYVGLGTMRPEDVDDIELAYPGFVASLVADESAFIDSRLRKRYDVPFGQNAIPVPIAIKRWCRDLVLPRILARRGANPSENDLKFELEKARDLALLDIKEAAEAQAGLFDLPLRQDQPTVSGISAPNPMGYSESSPYDWTDVQAEDLRSR